MNWNVSYEFVTIDGTSPSGIVYLPDIDEQEMFATVLKLIKRQEEKENCYLTYLEIREVSP